MELSETELPDKSPAASPSISAPLKKYKTGELIKAPGFENDVPLKILLTLTKPEFSPFVSFPTPPTAITSPSALIETDEPI